MTEELRRHPTSGLLIAAFVLLFLAVIAFVPTVTCPACKGKGFFVFSTDSTAAAIGCAPRVSFWGWWNDRAGTRYHQKFWFLTP